MTKAPKASTRSRVLLFLPALVFGLIALVSIAQLVSGRDLAAVPSALIGKPAPIARLGTLQNLPAFELAKDRPTIVNVWASWCAPCREENGLLLELGKDDRFHIAGINYKDKAQNALAFLADLGNPFDTIGTDENGRAAIDWGVYGVPETFIVGRDGAILYKHVGPLTAADLTGAFGKALKEAVSQ
ncbi:MAG: DsbE family thiol:disulfide interchange protein [Notoacmeibacter sp.]